MIDEVLVSIIVPIYNINNGFLEQCIQSLREQTMENIEIILISDGSCDENNYICEFYQKLDDRIRFYCQDNRGVSYTRNLGIEKAVGKAIMFVDADDWIECDFAKRTYEILEETKSDIVVVQFYSELEGGRRERFYKGDCLIDFCKRPYSDLQGTVLDAFYLNDMQMSLLGASWGKLFRKEFLQKYQNVRFPLELKKSEDEVFMLRALNHTNRVIVSEETLYHYRQHENSVTKIINDNIVNEEFDKMQLLRRELIALNKYETLEHCFWERVGNTIIFLLQTYVQNASENIGYREKKKRIDNIYSYSIVTEFFEHSSIKNKKKRIFFSMLKLKKYFIVLSLIKIYSIRG